MTSFQSKRSAVRALDGEPKKRDRRHTTAGGLPLG
jgi:hypothetical protein